MRNQTPCRHHSSHYGGGEVAKALGFLRASDAPHHSLAAVLGRTGLLRFWECCGEEAEDAPGCTTSYHLAWDQELNEQRGWGQWEE